MGPATQDCRIVRGYQVAAQVISWVVLGAGLVVLIIGWWVGVESVRAPIPGVVAMKANTAFAFALVGLSLVLYLRARARAVAVSSACLAALLGVVNLAEYLFGAATTRFDTLLGADPALVRPGRMAVSTALCFALLGVALVLLLVRRAVGLRQVIGVVVWVISLSGVLGYILGEDYLTSWGPAFTPIAFTTALLMLLLGPAIVMAEPNVGWARVICSPLLGGRLFRAGFLPLVVSVLIISDAVEYLNSHFRGGGDTLGQALAQVSWLAVVLLLVGLLFVASVRNDASDRRRVAADTELTASEHRYRTLAEAGTDIVYELDTNFRMLWVTSSMESVLGWRPEELLATSVLELVHPADREAVRARRDAVAVGVRTPRFELRMLAADGDYRWMSVQTRRTDDPEGGFAGAVVGLRDVHEEVVARLALADSEERYRLLAENATDVVFQNSADGVLRWASPSVEAVLGWRPEQLVGTLPRELAHPDDRDFSNRMRARAYGSGSAPRFNLRLLCADGSYRWMSLRSQITADADGAATGIIIGLTDVQEQVLAGQALEASQRQYRLLAENATDAVFLLDSAGVVRWVSPSIQAVMGYDPGVLVGTDSTDLVHPEDLAQLGTVRAQAATGESASDFELRMRTADGRYRWVAGATGPALDADGNVVGRITSMRDVHERVLAGQELARSEQTFRLAMDGAPQGMAVVGLQQNFLQVNPALCAILGRDEQWMLAHTVRDVIHPDDLETCRAEQEALLTGTAHTSAHDGRWRRADGSNVWVVHSIGLLRDEQDQPLFYVMHVQDNTDAHRVREELASRANHDPLTGLINRNQLQAHLVHLLTVTPHPGVLPAVLFCDLDFFKPVNDQYGHAAGDAVLVTTAHRIASTLRSGDTVARLGGDEFVVVLDGVPDVDAAIAIAQKVRAVVAEPIPIGHEQTVNVTISVGIAMATDDIDGHRLLRNADAALYRAKDGGRDQIAVFNDAATSRAEANIRHGLAHGQFVPWFQPIVNLADGALVGYEALVRWVRPDGCVVDPAGFLPLAERTDLITELDHAVLEKSVQRLRGLAAPLFVAVNVSATSIATDGYALRIIETLNSSGVDPARLHLEFTETALLGTTASVKQAMSALSNIGVRWYVDDFGTGYSSISHLRDLPVAGLKLDLSFTTELGSHDPTSESLAQALIGLADGLGLDTVAEGIETQQQAAILIAQGWQHGQGWLYGRPQPLTSPPAA